MKDRIFIDGNKSTYKGNMHMHTVRSDGRLTPQEIVDEYKNCGYDFIVISDHEVYWNSDEFDTDSFLVLGGTESSIRMDRDNPWLLEYRPGISHRAMHLGCVMDPGYGPEEVFYKHGEWVPRVIDRGLDSWNYAVRMLKEHGNIVFINHPDWSRTDPELLLGMEGCFAFEIWNSGNVQGCGGTDDSYVWDYMLRRGKKIFAVAGDDAHGRGPALCMSFTAVQADSFTKQGIVDALKRGSFYASTGPEFYDIRIEDDTLKMRFSPARRVEVVAFDGEGKTKYAMDENLLESFEWEIKPNIRYIRPFITDDKGRTAWAQPIFMNADQPVFSPKPDGR